MGKVTALATQSRSVTLVAATEAFFDHAELAVTSTRVYLASLSALQAGLGVDQSLDDLNGRPGIRR